MEPGLSVRLRDVAERAGVSTSTASLVLSGKGRGRISASTFARVREAAEALGYAPPAHRAKGQVIGLAVDVRLGTPSGVEAIEAAQDEAWRSGQGHVVVASVGGEADLDKAARSLRLQGATVLVHVGARELDDEHQLAGAAALAGGPVIVVQTLEKGCWIPLPLMAPHEPGTPEVREDDAREAVRHASGGARSSEPPDPTGCSTGEAVRGAVRTLLRSEHRRPGASPPRDRTVTRQSSVWLR